MTTTGSQVPKAPQKKRWLFVILGCGVGCATVDNGSFTGLPKPEHYETGSDFSGKWLGEIDGQAGALSITRLDAHRYYGLYAEDAGLTRYVLNMTQRAADSAENLNLSNQLLFTWQDGRGGRGQGWLLINREDSALTGGFIKGRKSEGMWTFIRVE